MPPKLGARGLWKPLRLPVFRELLVADVVSDIGTFMQSVGAAWLMVSMHASPFYVALTQTASTAPFFLLALPAGALGDIVDRRKLILYTEAWMLAVAVILAVTTLAGAISPWLLLALTFALSAGDAMESPTWRAVLPELVGKDDLPAASALNGIEFNIARAVGPALAGLLIAAAGVGAAFLVNVFSFFGVILVIARWKRPVRPRTAPTEALTGAAIAAIRYVRHVPAMRAIMLRSAAAMFCASASFALLPVIANRAGSSSITYGLLLGAFGVGAVVGALAMQAARARWPTEPIVAVAIGVQGVMTIAIGRWHAIPSLMLAMFVSGAASITFISLANALVQSLAPDWVRARVLAIFMLLTQGGFALGSVLWGAIGSRAGVESALLWAGLTTIATVGLAAVARWPDEAVNLSRHRKPQPVRGDVPRRLVGRTSPSA